jgi:hypothetical protein
MTQKEFGLKCIFYLVLSIPVICFLIQLIDILAPLILVFVYFGVAVAVCYLCIRGLLTAIAWIYYAIVGYDEDNKEE